MGRRRRIWFVGLLVAACALRLQVAWEFHAPAGDGLEYHKLAHELRTDGRFAYGPPPMPLAYGRTPGYPLLIAALIDPGEPNDIETVLVRGTRLNVLFDAVTAVALFALAVEAGLGAAAWVAYALALACPLLVLNCCYLLRESFATALTTVTAYLLVRALGRRERWPLIVGGALCGLTTLVRPDGFLLGLAFVVPWLTLAGWRRRLTVAALSLGAFLVVFAPWPLRNQRAFGDPHPWGATWPSPTGGAVYPTGARDWMRTWINGLHQGWLTFRMTNRLPLSERDLPPNAADTPEERRAAGALLVRFNDEGFTPAVDQGFHDLAVARLRAHPLRTLVWLPLRRALVWWFYFTPWEEQPLRSRTLAQPTLRPLFLFSSNLFFVLGIAGFAFLLHRSETRALAGLIAIALAARSIGMSLLSPDGCQRYLAPVYPILLLCVAVFVVEARDWWAVRRRAAAG
jgi:hypothetical protein